MESFEELARLAYFEERRRRAARGLSEVADELGVSLRTVGILNRKHKESFFAPERLAEPERRITGALVTRALSSAELARALPDIEAPLLHQALTRLTERGWVRHIDDRYELPHAVRIFVDENLARRIDGINQQAEILADAVWSRFVAPEAPPALARSWTFAARPEQIAQLAHDLASDLRHRASDVEEVALQSDSAARFGLTIALTPLKDDP